MTNMSKKNNAVSSKKITQKCSGGNTNPRARNYCVTLNNYSDEDYKNFCECKCKYIVVGKEVGESGTPHLQTYVEFSEGVSLASLKKKLMCKTLHAEPRYGTAEEASDYCKKDGDYFEKGSISKQGARKDLIILKDEIMAGKSVDSIVLEDPVKFHQYGRTLNKIEDLRMRGIYRTVMTKGIWYYGKTGVGKSHKAFEGYSPGTHYVYPYDNGWWDGYTQQETVVINEFRGQDHMVLSKLLNLVDKWPCFVKRRNREPLPFVSKRVIITSDRRPDLLYDFESGEEAQLMRRFDVICISN